MPRWRVLYRMVGHMMMMLIVPSSANSLSALDFLDRAIRVITLDYRSVETTPEKLWRRYPEVSVLNKLINSIHMINFLFLDHILRLLFCEASIRFLRSCGNAPQRSVCGRVETVFCVVDSATHVLTLDYRSVEATPEN